MNNAERELNFTKTLTIVIPRERGERASTRGPMTKRSDGMGNVRVSSDRGICSAALPEAAGRATATAKSGNRGE